LKPIKDNGIAMNRAALVQHAIRQSSILEFIGDLVQHALNSDTMHHALMTLYLMVYVQYLDALPAVEENHLLLLLPRIVKFAAQTKNADVQVII
jgi:hypothetical protein